MDKIKIAYVVLHYKNAEVTIKCLQYLLNVMSKDSVTVVVDNNSQDNSVAEVKNSINDTFKDDDYENLYAMHGTIPKNVQRIK